MSIMKSVASAIGTAITSVAKASFSAIKTVGRAGVCAVRLAGRAAVASVKMASRAAYAGAGTVLSAADRLFGMFGPAHPLPEPAEQEVFSPTEEWVESMETAHLAHELQEVDTLADKEPNALAYKYLVSDDKARRNMSLSSLSPEVQGWCHSLVESERQLVRRAGVKGMLRHLHGGKEIKGVRKLKARESVIDFTRRDQSATFEMDDSFRPRNEMRLAM